nr:protein POLR1D-like [Vicugna pacos]
MGPMGWMKCPLAGTNKRFLINTIKNTLPSHKEQDHEQKEGSKEPARSQNQKEASRQKHRTHPLTTRGRADRGAPAAPRRRTTGERASRLVRCPDRRKSPKTPRGEDKGAALKTSWRV